MWTKDQELPGNQLTPEDQAYVLRAYVHRFTQKHRPVWAIGTNYKPGFRDDADWLANTRFRVTKSGRLDRRCNACYSTPTWPEGNG